MSNESKCPVMHHGRARGTIATKPSKRGETPTLWGHCVRQWTCQEHTYQTRKAINTLGGGQRKRVVFYL